MSFDNRAYFSDKKIYLREARSDDYQFIYRLVEEFLKTDLSVTVLEMPSFEEFFKVEIKRYIITDGKILMGFVQILKNNEVGYFVHPDFQNRGIGVEGVKILMEMNPRERYFATINDKNIPSKRLVEKLGFKPKAVIYEKIVKP